MTMSTRDEDLEQDEERDVLQAVRRLVTLASLVTVRQAVEAGDDAIEAAGLNPWCINEGLATGDERVLLWWAESLLDHLEEQARAASLTGSQEP